MFDLVETNLMVLYNPGTRKGLIAELEGMMRYLSDDEKDLRDLTRGVIRKLRQLSDADYAALDLFPDMMKGW